MLTDKFKKSTFSWPFPGCVEVRKEEGDIFVRDSKNSDGPVLLFNKVEWDAFIKGVNNGEFDLPKQS